MWLHFMIYDQVPLLTGEMFYFKIRYREAGVLQNY